MLLLLSLEQDWAGVSETARSFVRALLTLDPTSRPTVDRALEHPWLSDEIPHFVPRAIERPLLKRLNVEKVTRMDRPARRLR